MLTYVTGTPLAAPPPVVHEGSKVIFKLRSCANCVVDARRNDWTGGACINWGSKTNLTDYACRDCTDLKNAIIVYKGK